MSCSSRDFGAQGYVLTVVLRLILLLAVVGQLLFLASRHRIRQDLTSDQLYSLTSSTERVLAGLDDRLLVECYFTRDERLPAKAQSMRRELKSVLDEYVRRSNGKMALRFFDPQSDTQLKQKAERMGLQVMRAESRDSSGLNVQEIWQGVRLRYGGGRQKVLPILPLLPSTFQYEAVLTPAIKELTTTRKPKVKVLAFPTTGGARGPAANRPTGFEQVQAAVRERYDITPLDLSGGKLVPADTEILLLIRPRALSDRQKYAIDQFLMAGGKLVVFADTDEVDVGDADRRLYLAKPIDYDAPGSKVRFLDQLAGYGAAVEDKLIADFVPQVQERMVRYLQSSLGYQPQSIDYPYWFFALNTDWGTEEVARSLATDRRTGAVDEEKLRQYRGAFKPGMAAEHPLTQSLGGQRGPGMFWPCPVDLVAELPAGVRGEVLLRTSPVVLVGRADRDLNPLGQSDNPRERIAAIGAFQSALMAKLQSEPRRQAGLMVSLTGTFQSAFADREIPPAKPAQRKPPEAPADPFKDPVTETPQDPPPDEAPIGPPVAVDGGEPGSEDAEPAPLLRAEAAAQLVVVGDSDFIRDDLITGAYMQPGKAMVVGPVSVHGNVSTGALFFIALLDWLAQDDDLVALRQKQGTDRTLKLAERDVLGNEPMEAFMQRVKRKETLLQWLNVLAPPLLLMVLWLLVSVVRRVRRGKFFASLETGR